jgi:hypothetical protein
LRASTTSSARAASGAATRNTVWTAPATSARAAALARPRGLPALAANTASSTAAPTAADRSEEAGRRGRDAKFATLARVLDGDDEDLRDHAEPKPEHGEAGARGTA